MMELVRYNAALKAVAEALTVDEVMNIRNKAEAMRIYAKQSENYDMQNQAAEIRLRAERRAGVLLTELKDRGERAGAGNPQWSDKPTIATLADLGVTKDHSSLWQTLGTIPEKKFNAFIAQAKGKNRELTTGSVLQEIADDPEFDTNLRLGGLSDSGVSNRPKVRGPYGARRGPIKAAKALQKALEELEDARKENIPDILQAASPSHLSVWRKTLPTCARFLKEVDAALDRR